jgi:hypothetical protein
MAGINKVTDSSESNPIKDVQTQSVQQPQLKAPVEAQGDSQENILAAQLDEYVAFWQNQLVGDGVVTSRVLKLLIALTETMQDVAVAEAHQLSNLSELQQAYMDLKSKIPVLTKGQPGAPDDADQRRDMNNTFSIYMDSIKANEGQVQDKQKSVQANINTRKDNPFSSLFDSLLEMNKRLVSQIFR